MSDDECEVLYDAEAGGAYFAATAEMLLLVVGDDDEDVFLDGSPGSLRELARELVEMTRLGHSYPGWRTHSLDKAVELSADGLLEITNGTGDVLPIELDELSDVLHLVVMLLDGADKVAEL